MGSARAADRTAADGGVPHPAALAWSRLTGTDAAPTRVSVLKRGIKSQVYRLHGLLDGSAMIAKRRPIDAARIERTVHEQILPDLPVPILRWYGFLEDEDAAFGWLFTEDAGDEAATRSHDALIARWLGTVHAAGAERARRLLPERGAAQYLAQLRGPRTHRRAPGSRRATGGCACVALPHHRALR